MGDFNCPGIDWSRPTPSAENAVGLLCDYIVFNGYSQCVLEPTRGKNILDVLFTDEPLIMRDLQPGPAFSTSDHDTVYFTIDAPTGESEDTNFVDDEVGRMKYMWSEADFTALSEILLEVNWTDLFTTHFSPDDIWSTFSSILDDAIGRTVPSVPAKSRRKFTRKSYPRHIRVLFRRKQVIWRKYKLDRDNKLLHDKYKAISDECKTAVRRYEIAKENEVINSDNLGKFYRYVNNKMSCRSGVGALINKAGEHVTTDIEKSNVLNEYFSSVCTKDNGITPPFNISIPSDTSIHTVKFDVVKLLKAIKKIKNKNKLSCGPDGYPLKLLTALAPVLVGPLSQMYDSFMSVGKLPSAWKKAIVTPVFKKGSSSDPGNYRPISQTSVFCKLMERVIASDITEYLLKNNLLNPHQHGFLAQRSTLTNLLESTNDWSIMIDNKKLQTAIYIDFSKAFDTVSHPKIMAKLKSHGITGDLLSIIEDFLHDRSQQTRVGSRLSDTIFLTSGIVQGSCLGPLLFLIYINDVCDIFRGKVTSKLFADDLKLYSTIESELDEDELQICLDDLNKWAETWQLTISIKKCQTLQIGSRALLKCNQLNCKQYHIGSDNIPSVQSVVDLGVTVDKNINFNEHIQKIVRKASTRCYLIRKCFISRHTPTLLQAFKTYVRPLLEYNSPVWSPHLHKDINIIEKVQRRFTKRLSGLYHLSYDERLSHLQLERLEARRIKTDVITAYKIIFGKTILNPGDFFSMTSCPIDTRGHPYKLLSPQCKCDTRKFCFASRVVPIWNRLPTDTTNFTSLNAFKLSLNNSFFDELCLNCN